MHLIKYNAALKCLIVCLPQMYIILNLQTESLLSLPVTSWEECMAVPPRPSIALTCCLSDKRSRCWHYQILSGCCRPLLFALLWFLDEVSRLATWLWRTVLFVCYVTNRCASGVPYQPGLMLTSIPSTRCISLSCCRLLSDTANTWR